MFTRLFGKSRPSPPIGSDGEFEIVGTAEEALPEQPDANFTIEGATAFHGGSRPPSCVTARSVSHEDPMSGVPFKLTIDMDPTSGSRELSAAMAVVSRMQALDWDEFSYTFKLEQNVVHECSTKLQCFLLEMSD